jgi:hypothetical protein
MHAHARASLVVYTPAALPPAMIAPIWAKNHSGELKPMMLAQSCSPNPSLISPRAVASESA